MPPSDTVKLPAFSAKAEGGELAGLGHAGSDDELEIAMGGHAPSSSAAARQPPPDVADDVLTVFLGKLHRPTPVISRRLDQQDGQADVEQLLAIRERHLG